jgi:hypothetical protein
LQIKPLRVKQYNTIQHYKTYIHEQHKEMSYIHSEPLEDYLKLTKIFNNRQLLTKFKTSDHPLEIELGRYKKIPRHQRLCKTCKVL